MSKLKLSIILASMFITAFLIGAVARFADAQGASLWFPSTNDDPEYVIGGISDGCATWSSNVLTSTGSACGSGSGSGGGLASSTPWTAGALTVVKDNGSITTISTSTLVNSIFPFTSYGASTSTIFGFLNGLFSTASSTFSSAVRFPSLSQGVGYIGSTGLLNTTATGTITCSGTGVSCSTTGLSVLGGNLTITGSGLTSYDAWTHPAAGKSATTSELQITGGLLSTASTTISNALRLSSLGQGFLYTGSGGLVQPIASSSINLSWFNNDSGFKTFAWPFDAQTYGVSTTTTVGFLNGLFSTASSTFSSSLRLPSLSQGLAYIGSTGLVNTTATTTVSCSGSVSCTGFVIPGSSPITITGSGGSGSSPLATTSPYGTQIVIYTLNDTDILTLGSNSTTSAEIILDPNTSTLTLGVGGGADSTAVFGPSSDQWIMGYDATDKTFAIASSTALGTLNKLTLSKSGVLTTTYSTTTYASMTTASSTEWIGGGLGSDCDADAQTLGWDVTTKQFTCGDDDNSGGGSAAQASTTATYVIYKSGSTYYAYNSTTTAVTSNASFSTLLQSVVDVLDDGPAVIGTLGGSIHLKQGVYYVDTAVSIKGNDNGGGHDAGSVEISGEGPDATKIVTVGGANFLDFDEAAMPRVRDMSVYVAGASSAFVSDSANNNGRAVWNFDFDNISIIATTTHTGYGFNLGNAFRGTFENIEMFGLHNCARFWAEGTFNPGDFNFTRSFCELDNAANAVAFTFDRTSTGFMNQVQFDTVEGIAVSTGAKFINGTDLSYSNFINLNAEEFDILVDLQGGNDVAQGNDFQFNYTSHRNGIASLRGCRFGVSAPGNSCHFKFMNSTANFSVVDDMNTNTDSPNIISGYIGSDAGTASASTSASTLTIYRDISGYGTIDTNLKPNSNFGTWQFWGTLLAKGTTAAVDFANAVFMTIPTGTAPTLSHAGDIAYDTTDKQLLVATTTANTPAIIPTMQRLWSATVASTSVDFVSGGRIWMPPQRDGFDVVEMHCAVDGGTSVVINISNSGGTTDSETLTCDADGATDTSIDTNSLYAAGSLNSLEIGTITGSVDYLTFTIYGYITRE